VKFRETPLAGAFVIELERLEDERGFFARSFCRDEFAAHGLAAELAQASVSFNRRRGTLRGMHFQAPPHEEHKVVRCTRGAMHDIVVDLRAGSPTFRRWHAVELTDENRLSLYVPPGMAHGFQTLADDTEVLYQMSVPHHPESARGLRFDDPALKIAWPLAPVCVSQRDLAFPLLGDAR
jgi:dTDP-4-dehydrorhamnose 3,5-epimerase